MPAKIDIIIPVYNGAPFVEKIIGGLEKQTLRDFRAIFVDDGSRDDSYELLERRLPHAAFSYLLLRQENGGAAAARNTGLRAAEAEWIAFVDNDDDFAPCYLEQLYRAVTETGADLGVCGFHTVPEGEPLKAEPAGGLKYEVITPADCMNRFASSWLGVYCLLLSGELQRRRRLFFDERCSYCEDIPFVASVIAASSAVAWVERKLYVYRTRQGSLSRSPRVEKFQSGIRCFQHTAEAMAQETAEAAEVFLTRGVVRYYIATIRKAAVQLPYDDFRRLTDGIPFRDYRGQISKLTGTQKIASYLYLFSRPLFYRVVRVMFHD